MEFVSALRTLARRRYWLPLGVLLAIALGAAAGGYVQAGPFARSTARSAVATAQIQLEAERPLESDVSVDGPTIARQAMLLGERLAADDTTALIARNAGVPSGALTVLSSNGATVSGRSSPLARLAVEAASSTPSRYRMTISSTTEAPIVSIVATAPEGPTAARLAAAAAPAMRMIIDAPDTVKRRVRLESLGPPRVEAIVARGTRPLVGAFAAVGGFVAWCWFVVVASALPRLWRKDDRWASDLPGGPA